MNGGGSVRDRIRAAELARQRQEGGPISPTSPLQGSRTALRQDEHVKAEFVKRGDGGWADKVNVDQGITFAKPVVVPVIHSTKPRTSVAVPDIRVTKPRTPVAAAEKSRELPGRINVPGAFEASDDPDPTLNPSNRRARPTVASTTRKPLAKNNKSSMPSLTEDLLSSDIPTTRSKAPANRRSVNFEDDEEELISSTQLPTRSRDSMAAKSPKQKDQKLSREGVEQTTKSKTKLTPEPKKKKPDNTTVRSPRPASKREERLVVPSDDDLLDLLDDDNLRQPAKSAKRNTGEKSNGTEKPRTRRKSSQPSPKIHVEESPDATEEPRRRSSLWPSFAFSQSQRRSMSNFVEGVPVPRPKSGHTRSKSADSTSVISEKPLASPRKELGFMEYASGKKLDYIPEPAFKHKPMERMGYVRSRNSTGGYSERFTRNKRYLRKPGEDEFLEYEAPERDRRERRNSLDQRKDEPWQVKFAKGLVKR